MTTFEGAPAVDRVGAQEWEALRDLRLRALLTDPDSFGSTWEDEQDGDEPWWRQWLDEQAWFVARDGGGTCLGMAVGVPAPGAGGVSVGGGPFALNGLWVDPKARGHGVARLLAGHVLDWARASGARSIALTVVEGNTAARALFEGLGFRPTGERRPRERDGRVNERLSLGL